MIRTFEEISNNAWPALQTMQYDGWILRFANGVTKRSNSVNLLYPSFLDPAEKIRFCEELYLSKGITPCFKITEIARPDGMDAMLGSRGYFIHSRISFQVISLEGMPTDIPRRIILKPETDPLWIDDFIRMNGFDLAKRSTYLAIMDQLCLPRCLVSVVEGDRTIAVGLGVTEGRYTGIFDIVTDPSRRNCGYGHKVVSAILAWGRSLGAETAYLQVLSDNLPAISLYRKMGFQEAYEYWYRMKGNG